MPTLERKYQFAEGDGPLVMEWVTSQYQTDPEYNRGVVSSLYYDSSDFRIYHEKRGSDFLKAKVRLRWYSTLVEENDDDDVSCFLEVKGKQGAGRYKQRFPMLIRAAELKKPYQSELLRDLPARLIGSHPSASLPLSPLVVVSYRRCRFVSPSREIRVCVDTAIRCLSASPGLLPFAEPYRLGVGVLETKSSGEELVSLIRPIKNHVRRSAFSKYAVVLETLSQPLGVRL